MEVIAGALCCYATVDTGPRLLSLRKGDGRELFYREEEKTAATRDSFRSIGGHRLWVAPENQLTYYPDNGEVEWSQQHGRLTLTPPVERHGGGVEIQKQIVLEGGDEAIHVQHSVKNVGAGSVVLAPWAITVMAGEGKAILPLPEKAPHDMQHLLPESQLTLWSYTDFSDPRWTFLPEHLVLRHEGAPRGRFSMQKSGIFHPEGWIAYVLGPQAFIKVIEKAERNMDYPDRGCNVESFTNPEFLEIETLAPLATLRPGESAMHSEFWNVIEVAEERGTEAIAKQIEAEVERIRQYMPSILAESMR